MNKQLFDEVINLLDELSQDTSVPKNVRKHASDSKTVLNRASQSLDLRCATVISKLDELTNDPNVPQLGRTSLYTIISKLEALAKS
ncbi:MAG: UPF0147 family protein [Thermoplasmata archaeon]|nr:UPF0147 family protein [Candidatus Thermoplasmatota archaeon]